MNNKTLPINLDILFKGWCWDTIRLCSILTDKKNIPWYIKHFIPLHMNESFFVRSYDNYSSLISIYDEVLDVSPVLDYNRDNIIALITDAIDNNGYILFGWDRYFVKGAKDFETYHRNHGALIHGYNKKEDKLDIVDININGKYYSTHAIEYKYFIEAFFRGEEKTRKEHIPWHYIINKPISMFLLKNDDVKVDLVRIWSDIDNQIRGSEYENIEWRNKGEKLYKIRSGFKIYKGYQELMDLLSNDNKYFEMNPMALYSIKYVMQHKALYKLRLQYLFDNKLIPSKNSLFKDIDEICRELNIVWSLIIKYIMNKPIPEYIIKCKDKFSKIEGLETKLLEEISGLFEKGLKDYYYAVNNLEEK